MAMLDTEMTKRRTIDTYFSDEQVILHIYFF
jgi:hypothetical protein